MKNMIDSEYLKKWIENNNQKYSINDECFLFLVNKNDLLLKIKELEEEK